MLAHAIAGELGLPFYKASGICGVPGRLLALIRENSKVMLTRGRSAVGGFPERRE
jgi:hypothetical protein